MCILLGSYQHIVVEGLVGRTSIVIYMHELVSYNVVGVVYPQPEAYGRVAAVCIGESIDLDEIKMGWTQIQAGSRDSCKEYLSFNSARYSLGR